MAGGAPSRASQRIAQAHREQTATAEGISLDALTASLKPRMLHRFRPAVVQSLSEEERRTEGGDVETEAEFALRFTSVAILMPGGMAIGGEAVEIEFDPHYAVSFLEQALEEARAVAGSKQEQPLKLEGLTYAGSMAEAEEVAAQAEAAKKLTGDGS